MTSIQTMSDLVRLENPFRSFCKYITNIFVDYNCFPQNHFSWGIHLGTMLVNKMMPTALKRSWPFYFRSKLETKWQSRS